jgi:hypothetical protein
VSLAVLDDAPARVPVAADAFWIGRDVTCDLCLWDLRVSRRHALVRRVKGEHVLSAEGKHGVTVNGKAVRVLNLRDGDEVSLTPPGVPGPLRLRFENALEGSFVPPGASVAAAWLGRDEARAPGPQALGRYDLDGPASDGGRGSTWLARERGTGRPAAVTVLGSVPDGETGDRFLRLATALAGATHPSLARVRDAGLTRRDRGAVRWLATDVVAGRPAALRIAEGPQPVVTVVRRLRSLVAALRLLHDRGVVHGGVDASNAILRPDGGATLVGFSRSCRATEAAADADVPPPGAGYAAPETARGGAPGRTAAADVFGLGALGYAMLVGSAPATGGASGRPARPTALGAPVPEAIEDALLRALAPEPADRPTSAELGDALASGAASLGARASS